MGVMIDSLNGLIKGIEFWKNRKNESIKSREGFIEAVSKVMAAVVATKAYLYDKRDSGSSREVERNLSQAWREAAYAIEKYDRQLFDSAQIKALGWADPSEWKRVGNNPEKVKLDKIIEQCKYLQDIRHNS